MRNFLTAGWRRYAVAFVVAAASLGVIGACKPTKPPPSSTPCGAGVAACLTITPDRFTFTSFNQTTTFTVKNLGPDTTEPLHVGVNSDALFLPVQDNCSSKRLVLGDQCTVGVISGHIAGQPGHGFLTVFSDNSQQFGVSAELFSQ